MERLIAEAARLDDSVKSNDMSFGNIVKAIHAVQSEMRITGTTALEAGRTISGSVASMKSAWANLVTGLADSNADVGKLVDDFITTIVGDGTDKNLGVFGNIKPAIETALVGASELVKELFPQIVEMLPSLLEQTIPNLVSSALSVVESIIDAISDNSSKLSKSIAGAITSILLHAAENTPKFVGGIITLILSLIKEIGKNLGTIIPALITGITEIISEIASRTPELTDAIFAVVDGIVAALTTPEGLAKMIGAGFDLLVSLVSGIVGSIPRVVSGIFQVIGNIFITFQNTDWASLGRNLVDGFKNGISNAWKNLKEWFKSLFDDLIGIAKKILGIASPSKVFKKIGAFTAEGFGDGFNKAFLGVERDIESALDFNGTTFGVSAYGSYSGVGALSGIGGTTFGTVNINIEGYNAQDDDELAEMIAEKLQIMTERKGAVFA